MGTHQDFKIVIASGVRGDTRRYRTIHLAEQCHLAGLNPILTHIMAHDFSESLTQTDLLILHRAPSDRIVDAAIKRVQANGGKVLYDTDDLLFDPQAFQWIDSPDFKDPVRVKLYREDMERLRRAMQASDAILVSTTYLAGQAASLNLPVYVHRNGFSLKMLEIAERLRSNRSFNTGKVILGYASGTPTHDRDFASISEPLRRVLDKEKRAVLWVIGPVRLGGEWQEYTKGRVIRLPRVPWTMLPGYLTKFEINLAPLVRDNPFARSKSEIKWMEAALVKVPTIASSTDAFQESIRPEVDGFLAGDSDEWQADLEHLIGDRDRGVRVGAAAYDEVVKAYHPLTRATEFARILNRVIPGAPSKLSFGPAESGTPVRTNVQTDIPDFHALQLEPTLFRMAGYSIKSRGFSVLACQVRAYLRRAISPIFPYRDRRTPPTERSK